MGPDADFCQKAVILLYATGLNTHCDVVQRYCYLYASAQH